MFPKLHKELPKETEERRTAIAQMERVNEWNASMKTFPLEQGLKIFLSYRI